MDTRPNDTPQLDETTRLAIGNAVMDLCRAVVSGDAAMDWRDVSRVLSVWDIHPGEAAALRKRLMKRNRRAFRDLGALHAAARELVRLTEGREGGRALRHRILFDIMRVADPVTFDVEKFGVERLFIAARELGISRDFMEMMRYSDMLRKSPPLRWWVPKGAPCTRETIQTAFEWLWRRANPDLVCGDGDPDDVREYCYAFRQLILDERDRILMSMDEAA